MENFIGLNINYLCDKNKLSQKDFGVIFGLTQAVVNAYIKGKSNPQVENIQKICNHFGITIDDFINLDLSKQTYKEVADKTLVAAEPNRPNYGNEKYVKQLEDMIELQKQFLENQKETIENLKSQLGAAS